MFKNGDAPEASPVTNGIIESRQHGLVVLSPANRRPFRRVLYVNSYGGVVDWERTKCGALPPHHMWGCPELVRMGYEVALAEPLPPEFYSHPNPFPRDLKLLKVIRSWLRPDDIIYCGHNVLFWIPFLKQLGAVRPHVVSLLFGREPLYFSRIHSGIIALNSAAADQARKLAPRATIAHLGWGVDLEFFPKLPYNPEWFMSCGRTHRDHYTLSQAASRSERQIRVISPNLPRDIAWSSNVTLVTGGKLDDTVTYQELLHQYYANCAASLIILDFDPAEFTGVGFTNLIEAMAMARPVIVTRTGALPSEIDVEKVGCGLHVPPQDPEALVKAIKLLADDPDRARAMGEVGRRLCEKRYNIARYATELHQFFQSL